MVQISITSNIKQFERNIRGIQRKQLPFATSVALNDTAFDVRKHIVEKTYKRDFQVRNTRFIGAALRVKKSTKRTLEASVFDKLDREFLQRHTSGGVKRPRGAHIAIPSRELKAKRSGKGVPKSLRPRAALANKKTFITRLRSSGQLVIMRRKTKKSRPVSVLYLLEPTARIRKTFRFYDDAERVVSQRIGPNFARAWRKALRTAKKR